MQKLSYSVPGGRIDFRSVSGLAGRLLVSMPQLDDGPFAKSVVLICSHDRDHAFGLIVNKPIDGLHAGNAVEGIRLECAVTLRDAPVYFGGPVERERGLILHTGSFKTETTTAISPTLGLTASRNALERLHGDQLRPETSRLVAGHAGWSAGQLDDELRRQFWLDLDARPALVFDPDPKSLWQRCFDEIGISQTSLSALSLDERPADRPLN